MPEFDPYHVWLGISPSEQPPSYFRLLGLSEGEADKTVVTAAAARQFQFVRAQAEGEHAADARRIMREIVTARNVLLDDGQRSVYEQGLKVASASSARLRAQTQREAPSDSTWIEDEPRPINPPNFDFNSYDNPFAEQNRDRWLPSEETVTDAGPVFGDGQTHVDRPIKKRKGTSPGKSRQRRPAAFELDPVPTIRRPKKTNSMTTAAVFIGANVVLAIVYFAFIHSSESVAERPAPKQLASTESAPKVAPMGSTPSFVESASSSKAPLPPQPQVSPVSPPAPALPKTDSDDEFAFPASRDPGPSVPTPQVASKPERESEEDPSDRSERGTLTDDESKEGKEDKKNPVAKAILLTRDGKDFVKTAEKEVPIADFRKKSQYVWRENLTSTPAGKPVFIEGQMGPTRGTKQEIALLHMGKTTPLIAVFSKEELPPKMTKLTREGRVGWYYGVFVDQPTNTPAYESVKNSFRSEEESEDITFRDTKREFILLAADDAGAPKAMKKIQFSASYPRENIDVSDPIQATVTIANDNTMPMVDLVVAVHVHLAHNVPAANNHLGTRIIFVPRIAAKETVSERVTIPSRVSGLIQIQVVPQALHGVPTPE